MLKINFLSNIEDRAVVDTVYGAVHYQEALMNLDAVDESIRKKNSIIENAENYSKDEVSIAKLQLAKLEKSRGELETLRDANKPAYDQFIGVVKAQCVNEYTSVSEHAPDNILRLVACGDNTRLFSAAILDDQNWKAMYEAFMRVHGVDNENMITESGMHFQTVEDYIYLKNEINRIMRDWFSLPVATEYTKPIKIKLNKRDIAMLHEAFVTGINVDIKKGKSSSTFQGLSLNTAIKKKGKSGSEEYVGQTFKALIAKIAFQYICG